MAATALNTIAPQPVQSPEVKPIFLKEQRKSDNEQKEKISKKSIIQAKLTVGAPDDPYEKEADTVADKVMRMPLENFVQRKCAACEDEKIQRTVEEDKTLAQAKFQNTSSFIQMKCSSCEKEEEKISRKPLISSITPFIQKRSEGESTISDSLSSSIQNSKGGGSSMDAGTQSFMENRFGNDFSSVKIHTGNQAVQMSKDVNAQAFTTGKDIYFNEGKYQPGSDSGKHLLAHELTHTIQQSGDNSIQRKPGDVGEPVAQLTSGDLEVDIHVLIGAYDTLGMGSLKKVFVVGASGYLYDLTVNGYSFEKKLIGTYPIRPISFPDYYLIQQSDNKFAILGGIDIEGSNGDRNFEYVLMGWKEDTVENKRKAAADDKELSVSTWVTDEKLKSDFLAKAASSGFAVIFNPGGVPEKSSKVKQDDKPVLSTDYPDWFKQLKKKIEALIDADRKTNKHDPKLPDKIFFYGSDGVQAQKGADAWTIEVEKGKAERYLTVLKADWDKAAEKDVYAKEVVQQLYVRITKMSEEAEVKAEEDKEFSEAEKGDGKIETDKWNWAHKLKKEIDRLIAAQKLKEPKSKDFPDKLSMNVQQENTAENVYMRIWVYKEIKDPKPDELPELIGGTLPVPLTENDKAEDWVPIIRKAAAALKAGAVSFEENAGGEEKDMKGDPTVLPPYPANIYPRNMNADRTTATIASNNFRMVLDTASVHGNNLLNLTLIHMGMTIGYSWKIYTLPAELSNLKKDPKTTDEQLVTLSNDYTRKNAGSMPGDVKEEYSMDYDWEQEVDMEDLGEGDFLITSKALLAYPDDWNMKRKGSVAGFPFTVKKAEELASRSAMADTNAIEELKKMAEREKDPVKKKLILDHIADLEAREKTDLLTLTRKDAVETKKLIDKAGELKKFILDDRARSLEFGGTKDYDPFMFRLKAFDKTLYSLYILVRQVFDYSYGDIYAIDEYTKIVQKQYDDLNKLEKRTLRLADNEELRNDLPMQRCVAALVKEDNGNLVPLILLIGHHSKSDPANGNYKMMLMDVTFDSPRKGDMTYVGGTYSSEKDAIHNAFVEFGEDNKYGNGKIIYRVAGTSYRGEVESTTTVWEYLGAALAVIGIVLLIAGAILSAGTLAPASAAGIAGIVTALGIAAGVAGAALAARNIYKRTEKGTFELDAEFALDVVGIIGAFTQVAGTAGRMMANFSRTMGVVQKTMTVQRLDKLLLIYDAVELGGNAILVGLKVQDDIAEVKKLGLPKDQEDEMLQQIALEAMQQGAMIAFASFSKVKDLGEHLIARIEKSRYKSFKEKGWVDGEGKITDQAPPFLRDHAVEPGKQATKAQQGELAWKETKVQDMAATPTVDKNHSLTITERGRIIRCSDFCTDLRMKYREILEQDPWMNKEMLDLETKAQEAAKSGNKTEAKKVADEAALFESKLKQADDLRKHLFGMSEKEIEDALETLEAGKITGGEKSGFKVDDTKIPKRQRRLIDVTDVMTEAELKELGKGGYKKAMDRIHEVIGKKISDIEVLKVHWDEARKKVLKGKEVTDYKPDVVIDMYKSAQRRFWENVRKDPAAVEYLKKHGFELEGDSGAAVAVLGPQGKATTERGNITNQERRVSLDHIEEKAQGDNWKKALDADNLELMFQNANSQKEIVQVKFGMRDSVTQ